MIMKGIVILTPLTLPQTSEEYLTGMPKWFIFQVSYLVAMDIYFCNILFAMLGQRKEVQTKLSTT